MEELNKKIEEVKHCLDELNQKLFIIMHSSPCPEKTDEYKLIKQKRDFVFTTYQVILYLLDLGLSEEVLSILSFINDCNCNCNCK